MTIGRDQVQRIGELVIANTKQEQAARDARAEARRLKQALFGISRGALDVLAEREAQRTREGFGDAHDDEHDPGELAAAGGTYGIEAANQLCPHNGVAWEGEPPMTWPWDASWWKPFVEPRRLLVKAAALLIAEIDKIDRRAGAK
jgi:hypothetical protein